MKITTFCVSHGSMDTQHLKTVNILSGNVRNITSILGGKKTVIEAQTETRSNPRHRRDSPTPQTHASVKTAHLTSVAAVNCSCNNSVGGTWHVYLTAFFAAVEAHLAVYFPLFTSRWTWRSHPSAVITDIDGRLKPGPLLELAGHYSWSTEWAASAVDRYVA